MEGQVLKINLQRTGTYPLEAKGRHQGWLGSLAELNKNNEPAKQNIRNHSEIIDMKMLRKHCCCMLLPSHHQG